MLFWDLPSGSDVCLSGRKVLPDSASSQKDEIEHVHNHSTWEDQEFKPSCSQHLLEKKVKASLGYIKPCPSPVSQMPDVVSHTFNTSTWETKAEESLEFKVNWSR